MALLTAQQVVIGGAAPTYGAVAASDTLNAQGGPFILHVKNAGGTQDIVTLLIPGNSRFGVANPDPTVTVPITNGERVMLVPVEAVDAATGLITITHSFITTVTCAVFRF